MPGLLVITFFCLVAAALSFSSVSAYGLGNAFGVATGSVAVVAMSQCLILAARPRLLEPLFGGLDHMYRAHKWLGITALGLMLVHNQFDPDFEHWVQESGIGDFAKDLGEVALYGLITLILLSWIKRLPVIGWEIPYQLWWFTHRLTGAFFALVAVHQLLVDTPYSWNDPLAIYLNVFCALGFGSYLFVELLARRLRRRAYRVESLERHAGVAELALAPLGRPMRWHPGQFAFLNVPGFGLGEAHPFTITEPLQPTGRIRFAIKPLGDWTRRLPDRLSLGATVEVEGPYGRFDFRKGGLKQIWIAGGVGITPFLAWAQSLAVDEQRSIYLLYTVRRESDAIGLDVLREVAKMVPAFSFDLVTSGHEGRLTADGLVARAPFSPKDVDLFFCGPSDLRRAILRGLETRELAPKRAHFEYFEFR
ncbi:ferric reductase-like transmembrane domain-containing protein [Pusillimonas sp. ANT_WB101]|uniref:ferredoxin reductase family protein n=1 Tax=Pusillimonas sp. ANT_WB101 TaxID=2597356 RepID=UPI0011EC24C2|nr:ferredoxin reductase family protein [Pusillimonas sp. ANT_WB101]KAA0889354.1 cytochrome C [Pusillimonas sp. ANT_WB101]